MLEQLVQDFRYGLRLLGKHRGFSAVAISTLALGIAANTIIFGLANALFLRPPAITAPDRVIRAYSNRHSNTSFATYEDFRDRNHTLTGLALFQGVSLGLRTTGAPEHVFGMAVTGNYFHVLGVPAALGRPLLSSDDVQGAPGVAVLSDRAWRTRFAGNPHTIGQTLAINGQSFTIVGVAPSSFDGMLTPLAPELWITWTGPAFATSTARNSATNALRSGHMVGRLRDNVARSQAQADLSTLATARAQATGASNSGEVTVYPATTLGDEIQGGAAAFVSLLSAIAGLILLIACVNLATLLLARATTRGREIGVRRALGASRGRLVRQLLIEHLPLSLAGAAIAFAIALAATRALTAWSPPAPVPLALDLRLDWRVMTFLVVMALASTVALGLAPALQSSRTEALAGLREGASTTTPGRARLRTLLMTAQVGMSTLLLITGAVLVRSVVSAHAIDPGFVSEGVVAATVDLETRGYTPEQGARFYEQLLTRLGSTPGVRAASVIDIVPLTLSNNTGAFLKEGQAPPPPDRGGELPVVYNNGVTRGHFQTMSIPLLAGRDFTAADSIGRPNVAIVNETLAHQFWPGESAVGKRVRNWEGGNNFGPWIEVVGVARDSKYVTVGEDPRAFIYQPLAQAYTPGGTVLVKANRDAPSVLPVLRAAVHDIDPDLPVFNANTLAAITGLSLLPVQFAAAAAGGLGIVALVLVAIGIFGVVSYVVHQRTREIGIRMALGAQPGRVVQQLTGQGVRLTIIGLVLGLAVSALATRLLGRLLYGVGATDAFSFAAVAAVLVLTVALAAYVPARRATRIDPISTLRYE
jgi:putative ABC transport system permease protein